MEEKLNQIEQFLKEVRGIISNEEIKRKFSTRSFTREDIMTYRTSINKIEGDIKDKDGTNILVAAYNLTNNLCIAQEFITKGADVNGFQGDEPLIIYFSKLNDHFAVDLLLKNGANPNVEYQNNTPMYWACLYGSPQLAEILLKYNFDTQNKLDMILYWAILQKNKEKALELMNSN